MAITASTALLPEQWGGATRLRATIDIFLGVSRAEIDAAATRLREMQHIDTAEGEWLDRIGDRLGCPRPTAPGDRDEFGFGPAGDGFDLAPFASVNRESLIPIADDEYRAILRARAVAFRMPPTAPALRAAAAFLDAGAAVVDNHDMTATITASGGAARARIRRAITAGALPIPAGAALVVV